MLKNGSPRRREISDTNILLDYKDSDISDWKARNSEKIEKYKTRAVKELSEDVETGSRSEETGAFSTKCIFNEKIDFGMKDTISGTKDVLIFVSRVSNATDAELHPNLISFRNYTKLTEEDRKELVREGIASHTWKSETKMLEERYQMEKSTYNVVGVFDDRDLTPTAVFRQIVEVCKTTKRFGIIIWYFGPSRIYTGDWCFKYGFITMEQIRQIYDEYFSGKMMTVVSDCNYSGSWVSSWMNYMDKHNIKPCQHSTRRHKAYLSFVSSCGEHETATSPLMVARAFSNDFEGKVWMRRHKHKLAYGQHLQYCITTIKTCDADYTDPCSLPVDFSWSNKCLDERIYFVKGRMFDRWAVVSVTDSDEIIDRLRQSWLEDLQDFRQSFTVLDSGVGRAPSAEILHKFYRLFPMNNIRLDL